MTDITYVPPPAKPRHKEPVRENPDVKFTEAEEKALRALWASGKPVSEIALALGTGRTRNSIIGKAHRMGLEKRKSPIRPKAEEPKMFTPPQPVPPPKSPRLCHETDCYVPKARGHYCAEHASRYYEIPKKPHA